MQSRRIILTVAAPCREIFNFLADIEHLPAWSGGFCELIELQRDGWWAYTALGEVVVETKVDDVLGKIDLMLRPVSGQQFTISVQVRSDGDEGTLVTLACRRPIGLSSQDYQVLVESLYHGLHGLAGRFQSKAEVSSVELLAG